MILSNEKLLNNLPTAWHKTLLGENAYIKGRIGWKGLKQSEYLLRGELASLVNSRKSKNARSMEMLTTITTKQEQTQTFKDATQEKKGFSLFSFAKKKA